MNSRRAIIAACLLLLSVSAAFAQAPGGNSEAFSPGPVRGPILGYVFDQELGGLRPILGIPGSSVLGGLLDLGVTLASVEVSPGQDYALAVEARSGEILHIDLEAGRALALTPGGAAPRADRILISPTGSSAALYYRDPASVQILAGLPRTASPSRVIDLSGLPRLVTAMAISDDGEALLIGVSEGPSGSLFVISPNSGPRFLGRVGTASAIRFLDHTRDALISDYGNHEIVLLREVSGGAERILLAGARDGIWRPVAVAGAPGSRGIFALHGEGGTIAVVVPEAGTISSLRCDCRPTGLDRLKGDSVFRLTDYSGAPLFLLDGGSDEPRIVFVPPDIGSAPALSNTPIRAPRRRSGP